MKIISIEFENLNSLAGHWKIDFAAADFAASGILPLSARPAPAKPPFWTRFVWRCSGGRRG